MKNLGRTVGLLVVGLALGIGLGLYVGWVAWPAEFEDANLILLDEQYQDEYVQMVADVYASDQNLNDALRRLGEFGPSYETAVLNSFNNQLLQENDPLALRRLAQLANDIGLSSPAIQPLLNEGAAP